MTDIPPLRNVYGTGTHDFVPGSPYLNSVFSSDKQSPTTERAYAVYLAALIVGQRTPEELATVANYLLTGTISEWRNG